MTTPNWQKLKTDAADTVESINTDNMTKEAYILYGASLAVLDHDIMAPAPLQQQIDKTPEYYANDELEAATEYHSMNLDWIARDELSHAGYWINRLPKNKRGEYERRYDELVEQIGKPHKCDGCLDEFSEMLAKYDDTRSAEDRDEMRKTLRKQLSDIERELVEMRHEVHDPEAVQTFIEFRENLKLKI